MAARSVSEELGQRRIIDVSKRNTNSATSLRLEFDRPELIEIVFYPGGEVLVHVEDALSLREQVGQTQNLITLLPVRDQQIIVHNAEEMRLQEYLDLAHELAEEILCEE